MSTSRRWFTVRGARAAALGLLSGLVLLTGGDGARSASPANSGIDPLEVLNLQIKPNVFIVFDTSGSMRFPLDEQRNLGGDDPFSRLYQAKSALKQVIQSNATKVNFGFGTYNIRNDEKQLQFPSTPDNFSRDVNGLSAGAPILYVSNSPNGNTWTGIATNYFPATDVASNVGAAVPLQGAAYTTTAAAQIFSSFTAVSKNFIDTTACPALTPDCRRYVLSRLLRDNVVYRWNTAKNPITDATALVSANNFVCPLPPAGLFPQDPNVDATPATSDLRRPCFALENDNLAAKPQAIFWYSSGLFERASGDTCGGAAQLNEVVACNQDLSSTIVNNYLKPELPVDGSCGEASGFPCDVTATVGNVAGTAILGTNPSTVAGNNPNTTMGIIAGQSTPLAGSIDHVINNFATVYPNQFAGQKNFVLILTDGDDTCASGNPSDDRDGDNDFDDDDRAIVAAERAQALYARTGSELNPTAETLVVAFTSDVNKIRADKIAQAGSGGTVVTSPGPLKGTVACPPGVPCRLAYSASNATDLARVLNAAIQGAVNSGEFSDQQSITQSIYELSEVVESPTASGIFPFDPMDPVNRFASIPVLLQSTFEMPDFKGHLKAFRRAAPLVLAGPDACLPSETQVTPTTCRLWDAAEKLCQSVTGSPTCAAPTTWPRLGGTAATFAELHGANVLFSALPGGLQAASCATPACIKRRIYTTKRHGLNPSYTADNLAKANGTAQSTWTQQVTLWPPDTDQNTGVAPDNANDNAGSLDGALGLDYPLLLNDAVRFTQLQIDFRACVGSNLPGDCGGAATARFRQAKREAREMILAYIAGANFIKDGSGNPTRTAGGDILYRARPWILAESTLAAPAVVPPPLQLPTTPESDEYISYRDGPRNSAQVPQDGFNYGFGLRNPDDLATAGSESLKPVMTVAFHVTNELLHAFRAGPCPTSAVGCSGETGGEELWAFAPPDTLGKMKELLKPKTRSNHVYMNASPVRFNDVFVRGGGVNETIGGGTVSGDGVWRRLALFGRGAGGKFYTALDVTVPGPFTKKALATNPPILVWNRGNFDTSDGLCKTGTAGCAGTVSNSYNVNVANYNAYLKMGETWSVPTMSFVTPANNGGVEFMSYTGSGFSDVPTEGKAFFALATVNGNVTFSYDIPNRLPPPLTIPNHALVASPSGYQKEALEAAFEGLPRNPAGEKTTLVYFPDIHSRIWRYDTEQGATAPTLFATLTDPLASPIAEQPVANAVTLASANSDGTGLTPHIFAESGNDSRIPDTSPFQMFAFRDVGGTSQQLFGGAPKDFPSGFRGTVQPTAAFNNPDNDPTTNDGQLRVFFAGTRFNPAISSCQSSFDSIVFLLLGVSGGAAYDLTGDALADESITITNQRVTAIRVEGGQLVVDMGLGAQNPPPAPAPPAPLTTGAGGQASVRVGTANVPGTVPFRLGTNVCKE